MFREQALPWQYIYGRTYRAQGDILNRDKKASNEFVTGLQPGPPGGGGGGLPLIQ